MKIALGADHAGYRYKEAIKKKLQEVGHEVMDFGTSDEQPVGTAPFAQKVARAVVLGECDRGILICGTGGGMSVCANRYPGVRAVLCFNEFTAKMARAHNDANILVMGSRVTPLEEALQFVDIFLSTPFDGGKYAERLRYLEEVEKDVFQLLKEKFS
ncbi:MAG: ribose 5-phosphate isomerase [Candidatus Atribacteria bacterium]|jgi:ribose 5-phosphate isomerase B|nr:ribose 5-phosphate isomerase [Candidatus Atribacteria bacterium]